MELIESVPAGIIEYTMFSESVKWNYDYVNLTGFELLGSLCIIIS